MPVVISFLCREEYSDTIVRELSEELGLQTVDRYGIFPQKTWMDTPSRIRALRVVPVPLHFSKSGSPSYFRYTFSTQVWSGTLDILSNPPMTEFDNP